MDVVFSLFTLVGGLAFFLYGMSVMSSGLEKLAGGKLETTLRKMTDNKFKSLALGAGITIAIQSSSAMTVMLVGLVNSGIMQFDKTVGVIMGSNVGTTLTAWILSTVGIESSNVFIKLLKPEVFSPVVAFIGILLIMVSKKDKRKSIGGILVGFAVLMFGMELMKDAVEPLTEMEGFKNVLTAFKNPILGVIVGAVFTGVIQSSAASVGILQALALTGNITFGMAIPIIMGQNIGTCVTALLSSIGVNKNAKRVGVIHISFNIIGTVLFLVIFYGLDAVFKFAFTDLPIDSVWIAAVHSIFNILATLVLLPFSKLLVKIADIVVKDTEQKQSYSFIDERLLSTPSVAIAECNNKTVEMAQIARDNIDIALKLFDEFSEEKAKQVKALEDKLDKYEDHLGTCLVKLSSKEISASDSRTVAKQLHTIDDFERIGDHALNLAQVAAEINAKNIAFSPKADGDIRILSLAIREILDITINAFSKNDTELAKSVEPLEQVIDDIIATIKNQHIKRLQSGDCTIQMGFVLSDLLTNYERISDHCSNIAAALIETHEDVFDVHEYLNEVKNSGNEQFENKFKQYKEKYSIV